MRPLQSAILLTCAAKELHSIHIIICLFLQFHILISLIAFDDNKSDPFIYNYPEIVRVLKWKKVARLRGNIQKDN